MKGKKPLPLCATAHTRSFKGKTKHALPDMGTPVEVSGPSVLVSGHSVRVAFKISTSLRFGEGEWDKIPLTVEVDKTFNVEGEAELTDTNQVDGSAIDLVLDLAKEALEAGRGFVVDTHPSLKFFAD